MLEEPEEWREIEGYERLYFVSDYGRVRSLSPTRGERILQPVRKSDGYLAVNLCLRGERKMWAIHKLVMIAFVGPVPVGYEVSHLDGSRDNNVLPNLRYESHANNCKRRSSHGTAARNATNVKLRPDDIPEIRRLAAEGLSQSAIGKRFGVTRGSIYAALSGKTFRNPELTGYHFG